MGHLLVLEKHARRNDPASSLKPKPSRNPQIGVAEAINYPQKPENNLHTSQRALVEPLCSSPQFDQYFLDLPD